MNRGKYVFIPKGFIYLMSRELIDELLIKKWLSLAIFLIIIKNSRKILDMNY